MTDSTPREGTSTRPPAGRAGRASAESERTGCAMAFLQEAVFRSRDVQARASGLAPNPGGGQCGLGEKAAVVLDLSERGATLLSELWPDGLDDAGRERVQAAMTAWIQRQDALDRKRNHFIKDFRKRHGFDRTKYDADQLATWESGLAEINSEADAGLRATAQQLLAGT